MKEDSDVFDGNRNNMSENPIKNRIRKSLKKSASLSLLREMAKYRDDIKIDCSTNSYLALHRHPEVLDEARRLTGVQFEGNLASRIISAGSPLYETLEMEAAEWKGKESALIFNSGYAANLGVLQALCSRKTEVLSDRLNHASIIDGIRLSGAEMTRYRHRDMKDLERKLKKSQAKEKVIITDTVFSMDGDLAPLSDIVQLAETYQCLTVVDEAHGTGIFGDTLAGLTEYAGVTNKIDVSMFTFSKAIGGLGAAVATNAEMRAYLVNTARSMIYSTGLPHSVLAYNLASLRYIRANPDMGKQVLATAAYLRDRLQENGCDTLESTSQIVPCIIPDRANVLEISVHFRKAGIKVPAIRPPTVPEGTERLRFSVHYDLSEQQIDEIVRILKNR